MNSSFNNIIPVQYLIKLANNVIFNTKKFHSMPLKKGVNYYKTLNGSDTWTKSKRRYTEREQIKHLISKDGPMWVRGRFQ